MPYGFQSNNDAPQIFKAIRMVQANVLPFFDQQASWGGNSCMSRIRLVYTSPDQRLLAYRGRCDLVHQLLPGARTGNAHPVRLPLIRASCTILLTLIPQVDSNWMAIEHECLARKQ